METRNSSQRIMKKLAFLALALFCTFMIVSPAKASAATLKAPKNVKVYTTHDGNAASGIVIHVKHSKVKGATGYQIKSYIVAYDSARESKHTMTILIRTKALSKRISDGWDYVKVKAKVRAYKKVNGKYVYGKWSSYKTITKF